MISQEGRREWALGWPAVAAASLGSGAVQIHFSSLGMLIAPVTQSMGWGVSTVTLGILICSMLSIPGAPFSGWLSEKIGLDRIFIFGLPLFFIAFGCIGLFAHSYATWVMCWGFLAVTQTATRPNLWMLWITQKFDASRGMALALLTCGAAVFGMFVPICTQLTIEAVGWRHTYPILAACAALIGIPAVLFALRASPPAPVVKKASTGVQLSSLPGLTLPQALRRRSFWQMALIAFIIGASINSLQVHLAALLHERHIDARTAALIIGAFGAASLAARFGGGVLLDLFPAKIIGVASLLLPACACAIYFLVPMSAAIGVVMAVLLGVGCGVEGDVVGYMTSRLFGVRSFGTIFGGIAAAVSFGSGVGPFTMGLIRDHFGSYAAVMGGVGGAVVICATLFATMEKYPDFGRREASGDAIEPAAQAS